jgi:uncharacterized membrane protein YdjX (TVP38/TMEM64 family)
MGEKSLVLLHALALSLELIQVFLELLDAGIGLLQPPLARLFRSLELQAAVLVHAQQFVSAVEEFELTVLGGVDAFGCFLGVFCNVCGFYIAAAFGSGEERVSFLVFRPALVQVVEDGGLEEFLRLGLLGGVMRGS